MLCSLTSLLPARLPSLSIGHRWKRAAASMTKAIDELLLGRKLQGASCEALPQSLVEPPGLLLQSQCVGSSGDALYNISIKLLPDQYHVGYAIQHLNWADSTCSCPAGEKSKICKHALALLLARLDVPTWTAAQQGVAAAAAAGQQGVAAQGQAAVAQRQGSGQVAAERPQPQAGGGREAPLAAVAAAGAAAAARADEAREAAAAAAGGGGAVDGGGGAPARAPPLLAKHRSRVPDFLQKKPPPPPAAPAPK